MVGKRYGVSLFFLWLMIAGPASAFCSGEQEQTPEQYTDKAREAIEKKRYKDAEKLLKQALSLKQDSPRANLLLGVVYRYKGEFETAMKHLDEAIRLKPIYPEAHYMAALVHIDRNHLKEATEEIKLAVDQGARSANIYMMKANLEMRDNKFAEALSSYEAALRLSKPSDDGNRKLVEQIEALKSYVAFLPLKNEFSEHRADEAFKKPVLKNRPMPSYSTVARRYNVQGRVYTAVQVNEQGKPDSILIFRGLGYGLDEEAVKAARRMQFSQKKEKRGAGEVLADGIHRFQHKMMGSSL